MTETGSNIVLRLRRERPHILSTKQAWKLAREQGSSTLPASWAWCAVEEAGDVQLGRQRAPQHHRGDHMRPYLRVANVLENRIDLTDVKWMNFTPDEFKVFALRTGDVLLNEGQSPDLLGRPAIYRGEIADCCFQKTLLRFRPHLGILPEFALLVFRHYMRSGRFRQEARITTNMAHLTQVRFVVMEFPVPPTPEQDEIIRVADDLEVATTEQFDHIDGVAIGSLRQSVLKAAFEGRLVEQSLAEEPADRLLARLSEQSETHAHTRRTTHTKRRAAIAAE